MTSSCTSMASEVFQWNGADVSNEGKQEKIKEELADVVNYCVLMADACGLDLDEIVWEKIKVNAKKYPVEKAKYLRQYVGDICTIDDSNEVIYIGADLPDEYAHSNYTHILKGANAKAKANAAQGLPELIKIADGKKFTENYKVKHNVDAMYGWHRYSSRFALPVFGEDGEIIRYNVFNVVMVIRHARDGKKYLYDIINIKKETSTLFQSEDITQ